MDTIVNLRIVQVASKERVNFYPLANPRPVEAHKNHEWCTSVPCTGQRSFDNLYSHLTNDLALLAPAVGTPAGDLCVNNSSENFYAEQTINVAYFVQTFTETYYTMQDFALAPTLLRT